LHDAIQLLYPTTDFLYRYLSVEDLLSQEFEFSLQILFPALLLFKQALSNMQNTLGQRITSELRRSGISMRELARRIGIAQPSISKWCHNQAVPKIEHLEHMAKIFGVSPQWLTFGSEFEREGAVLRPLPSADPDRSFGIALSDRSAQHFFGGAPENLALFTQRLGDMVPTVRPGDTVVVNRLLTNPAEGGVYLIDLQGTPVLRRLQPLTNGTVEIRCDACRWSTTETVPASSVKIYGRAVSRISIAGIA
jgi:transcriptional regulator with XRE-family HTH domain